MSPGTANLIMLLIDGVLVTQESTHDKQWC